MTRMKKVNEKIEPIFLILCTCIKLTIMTMNCGHCGTKINMRGWNPLYRTCDAYVCSPSCSRARMQVITRLDPNLVQPMEWANTSTIDPPKSFTRKQSFVGLGNLSLAPDVEIDMPIIATNERERYVPPPPVYRQIPEAQYQERNTVINTIANTVSTICMTAVALGVFLLAT